MHRRSLTVTATLSLVTPFAAIALMSSDAEAATPTFYNNAGVYQAGLGPSVTDDYSNPGYVFSQSNAQMSAVLGQTDYQSTGFGVNEINLVSGGAYCAGCNGSFRLIFTSTTVGNAQGVYGVGMNINVNAGNPQYTAFITYGDGTTQNVLLPLGASYWAVSAPERITSVHFGLPDAGTTNQGSFQIDNLQIGASPNEVCDGQALNVAALVPGSGASIQQLGSTVGALNNINEDVEIACYEFSSAAEHVYQFSLPVDTFLQVNTSGSNYDTKMAVVQGCPDGDTFCLYDDDIGGGDVDSSVPCTEYPAGGYSVVITGFNGATGNYVLNVTECQPCGNGVVDPGEDCDDDGESATCDVDCTNATCGDGYTNLLANEVCDTSGESIACDADCTAPSCGDGVLNMTAGEGCDDGAESETCNANCTVSQCGDGITNAAAGEECDDSGESVDCDDDCSAAQCGDSNVNETAGERCDDGGRSAACNANCTAASCGDGIFNAASGEECDGDGNGNPGQTATCDADCTNAMCGDGVLNDDAGEECDDGGDSKTCDADCTAASCGDGTINEALAEECDDGNTDDDDGCSAACEIEEEPGTSSGGEESSSGGEEESSGGTTDATDTSEDTSGPSTETDPTDADTSGSASGSGSVSDTNDEDDTSATNDDDGEDETTSEGATGGTADEGGCGCTTDDRRGNAWSVLALFGLGALVRRRRRA